VSPEDAVMGLAHGLLAVLGWKIEGHSWIVEIGGPDPNHFVFILKCLVCQVLEVVAILL